MHFPEISQDVNALARENTDFVGVLYVPAIPLTYPVTWKAFDNDYYLEHDFAQNENSAGWVFVDGWNYPGMMDVNTIIYGHNMRNGTMFGSNNRLLGNPAKAAQNPYIWFYGTGSVKRYRIFAFYTTQDDDAVYELPELEYPDIVIKPEEKDLETRLGVIDSPEYARKVHDYFNRWYDSFIDTLQENSAWQPEKEPDFTRRPRTILLSTCYGQAHGHTRFIIAGVLEAEYLWVSPETEAGDASVMRLTE